MPVKCDDGATRAAEVVMAALISRFAPPEEEPQAEQLQALLRPRLHNWAGIEIGGVRPTKDFLTELARR